MAERKIITTFVFPPIPTRTCDWQAHYDGDEPDDDGQMRLGEISNMLRETPQMRYIDRLALHYERQDLRAMLAAREVNNG